MSENLAADIVTTEESKVISEQDDLHKVSNLINEFIPLWKNRDAFIWPPDVFAVTSVILQRTGCYRAVITDSTVTRTETHIYQQAKNWIKWIAECLTNDAVEENKDVKHVLDLRLQLLTLSEGVTFEELRAYPDEDSDEAASPVRNFVKKLIELHALADEACDGFGILLGPYAETGIAHALANLLLVAGGSLASLPKRYGVVLPKFRTAADGLTIRSFSRHITHHISEVEIFWRTIPWMSIGDNKLNVLVAPYPCEEISDTWFNQIDEKFHVSRYFHYGPANQEDEDVENRKADKYLNQLIRIIKKQDESDASVDVVVLPELSLTVWRYNFFLRLLEDAKLKQMPIVVGGVRAKSKDRELNLVIVSSYMADYWYQVRQRKHHRWKLNRSQLKQYELADKFAGDRDWIEHIATGQRRLTVLAPSRKLALCTLICEDLARLEPVSEIIRGIGPNLLVALLLDGPQLNKRWPARYASVFADDPGTAVLSVTAMGMARRSHELNSPNKAPDEEHIVALWKDQKFGSKELSLHKNRNAVLLTLESESTQDFTADGRGGDGQSYMLVHAQHKELPKSADDFNDKSATDFDKEKVRSHKNWQDMRELAFLTYLIDSCGLLGSSCELGKTLRDDQDNWNAKGKKWIEKIMGLLEENKEAPEYTNESIRKVIKVLRQYYADPQAAGQAISARNQNSWHVEGFTKAVELAKSWIEKMNIDDAAGQILESATISFNEAGTLAKDEKSIIDSVVKSDPTIPPDDVRSAYIFMKKRRAKLVV